MAKGDAMLTANIERYLSIRKTLGLKLKDLQLNLRDYARFASKRGDTHITTASATKWAQMGSSPYVRNTRIHRIAQLAKFLHAEDTSHEVPSLAPFHHVYVRPLPYIYTPVEISKMIWATNSIREQYPLRREVYATLLGLIAATGLRVSEALALRFDDVQPGGVLRVRKTKFGKSRLVPLHPTATAALDRYLDLRRRITTTTDDHIFISLRGTKLPHRTMCCTFRRILKIAKIAPSRKRAPRVHDLRHTFATRALEKCGADRKSIAKQFLALSTYLGHIDLKSTYWYQEATPELMKEIAAAGEILAAGGVQ